VLDAEAVVDVDVEGVHDMVDVQLAVLEFVLEPETVSENVGETDGECVNDSDGDNDCEDDALVVMLVVAEREEEKVHVCETDDEIDNEGVALKENDSLWEESDPVRERESDVDAERECEGEGDCECVTVDVTEMDAVIELDGEGVHESV
jgi:hypothetical protein